MNQKIQRKNIVIANGTALGIQTFRVQLDPEFNDCVGLALLENTAGGLTRYDIGLKDDSKTHIDLCSSTLLKQATSYKSDDRFFKGVPFRSDGKTVTISIETFAATTSEFNVDILFMLKKDSERC